jgi:hypothetical protein
VQCGLVDVNRGENEKNQKTREKKQENKKEKGKLKTTQPLKQDQSGKHGIHRGARGWGFYNKLSL